jgi:shikimate kinase
MCAGKSTVGQALAEELGWTFIDIDREIEVKQGRAIWEIFANEGEGAFRELETETIRQYVTAIEAGNPRVLALGGGAFVQPRNWELIQNNGVALWLDCTLDTVLSRLGDDNTRPLACDPESLASLYEDRRPLYSRADFRIEVDSADVDEIVKKILSLPIF